MKPVSRVVDDIRRYLDDGWHLDAARTAATTRWPKTFTLGTVSSKDADTRYAEVTAWSHSWHDWAHTHDATLTQQARRLRGIAQQLPTHITLADPATAALAVGGTASARLDHARTRVLTLDREFPATDIPAVLRLAAPLGDVDFSLALTASRWFVEHPDVWPGLTPRQIPVEGLHGKWLNKHRLLLQTLTGLPDLAFAQRPTRVNWTYLDPEYLATGARRHDSHTLGDSDSPAYPPHTVLVVENKDTAVLFPPVPDTVAVEGNGNAAPGLLPHIPWIAGADNIIYWGDIDAAGYEILDRLRAALPHTRSILMDPAAYDRYEPFGTNVDERGNALKVRERRACPHLTDPERAVYNSVTNEASTRHRRVEQERIPLHIAADHVVSTTEHKLPKRPRQASNPAGEPRAEECPARHQKG